MSAPPDRRAEAVYFSPGRVNLIGEHTDYNGGWVLPLSINLGNRFYVDRNDQKVLRVFSVDFDEEVVLHLDQPLPEKPMHHWQDYFTGVLRQFELPPATLLGTGLTIRVESAMPRGSGLSSSASITTGFATVLNDFWNVGHTREQLATLARQAENDYVGVACGILDPFAVAMGRHGHAIALNCGTMDWEYVPFPDDYEVMVVDTGLPRKLTDSAYNQRRAECQRALALIQTEMPVENLSQVRLEDLDRLSSLSRDPVASRRARHVVTENARVVAAASALKVQDMPQFGRQLVASHQSLRDDYEVSCNELDILTDLSVRRPGVVGAKMTGAGFGGCIVAIVFKDAVNGFVANLGGQYHEKSGCQAQFHQCRPSDGVTVEVQQTSRGKEK